MGATFSRLKNWTTEVLSNTDLNAEIDNILNNLGPAGVDDYSTNAAQMRLQTSPGAQGTESLATSLAGEIERLRYVIQRMIGGTTSYWYDAPPSTLADLVAAIGTGLPTYRIVSGRTTGNSSQLCALIPNGTADSVTLSATPTPLVYYIGGTQYSITANQTLTGLSLADASDNTASVNNTAASGQQWTKFQGMYGTSISIDNPEANIIAATGQIVGLQVGNEYFTGQISSTASITNCWRGAMFNSSGANIPAVGFSDNAEVKLLRLAWIFANTNSSLAVTYANPIVSADQPTGASTGDYWFDLGTTAWRTFNSTTWVTANATLIGLTMQNETACVAARTFDSYSAMSELQSALLERTGNATVQVRDQGAEVSVFGSTSRFGNSRPLWNIASDLHAGLTESANTTYYLYMKESGEPVVSDAAPLNRKDLQGLYHPGETWRALGSVHNNNSTNFEAYATTFRDIGGAKVLMGHADAYIDYNTTADAVLGYLPQHLFPRNFAHERVDTGANYTVAQGTNQHLVTAAVTRGAWILRALAEVVGVGTAASAICTITINTDTTTAAQVNVGLQRHTLNGTGPAYCAQVTYYPVFVPATTNFVLDLSINNTAGASWGINNPRVMAERIDDPVGMP